MRRQFRFPYAHLVHACWHYAAENRGRMIFFYSLTFCANIIFALQPLALAKVINVLQIGGPNLLRDSAFWLATYACIVLAFWLLHGPSRIIERNIALQVRINFLQHYYDLLTHLPISWHQEHHSGSTTHRINKAAAGLYEFAGMQFIFTENIFRFCAGLGILTWISPGVGLAELLFAVIVISLIIHYEKAETLLLRKKNELEHRYSMSFFDYVGNITNVIALNLRDHTKSVLEKALNAASAPLRRYFVSNELKWGGWMILMSFAEFFIILGYIYFHTGHNRVLMLGSIVAIYQYMRNVNMVFSNFAANYQRVTQYDADLTSTEPLIAHFERLADRPDGRFELQLGANGGAIEFDHVHFAYNAYRPVFNNLNLTILPRQKVGLIGRSGAGKTTLIQLLLRFQEAQGGEIKIDGQPIGQATQESLRRHLALIPQDVSLFETSLLENIRYGRLEASEEEVIEAAKKAYAHEFIVDLPKGYHTFVGERGVRLSGGQRQRVAIARAILKNAPILILDEATSALDSESERYIQEGLVELMKGKTVIAIAHRLSTISHLDRLILLEKGEVIDDGTHAELLARDGVYAHLWQLQSSGFLGK